MSTQEIVILIVVGVLALCGILELIAYIIRKRYTNEETGEIIDEPGKFDAGDAYLLIDFVLKFLYFLMEAFARSGGSSRRRSGSGGRSSGSGSRRGGGGRGSGGGAGRR